MFKEIQLGEKSLKLLANGATPYRFKQVFHKDVMKIFFDQEEAEIAEVSAELAYIMNAQALNAEDAKKSMTTLNFDAFLKWLEDFEPLTFSTYSNEIYDVYTSGAITSEKSKKNTEEPNEK